MPSRLYILFHKSTVYVITESLKTAKQTKRVLLNVSLSLQIQIELSLRSL